MIDLTSYLYRETFHQGLARLLMDQLRPGDAVELKRIINFNAVVVTRYLRRFTETLIREVYGVRPSSFAFRTKGELKDFVTDHPSTTNSEIEGLIRAYRERPEDFYRETPVEGKLYYSDEPAGPVFLGLARYKRYRRIAEKAARRISDFVYQRIRENAEYLAQARARQSNVPLEQLHSSPGQMLGEFAAAERAIRESLKRGQFPLNDLQFEINDVAGLKLVAAPDMQDEIVRYVSHSPDMRLLEKEEHHGQYNATNLTVELKLDKQAVLAEGLPQQDREVLAWRGFDADRLDADLEAFVRSGEDTVRLEIILSGFEEFLESEIGRCMHEDRILAQRGARIYRGLLARNVEYLMTFLFAFAFSPLKDLEGVPIKVWGRYMPDYIDQVLRGLFRTYPYVLTF
jgi:hypothetical protein